MRFNRRWKQGAAKADSKWEGKLRDTVFKGFIFQGEKVSYTVNHKYTPDFIYKNWLVETKGRFRDSTEASKYKHIRNSLMSTNKELVFVFYSASKPMPHAKVRKDGTKMSHGEWAEKNGFRYFECDKDCFLNDELKEFIKQIKS